MPQRRNKLRQTPKLKRLNPRGLSRLSSMLVLVVWIGILGLIALNRQTIIDWWRLKHYTAPAAIAQLATQDTMTDYARKVFYVNQPVVQAKTDFNTNCPDNGGEQTIVLGCYHADQDGIFLLSVNDSRLNGVEQVTAAHELLHAAYDRLSTKDRQHVDSMLTNYFEHDLTDARIKTTIAAYKKSEPHDVVNEMHSVFGTEVANLPAPLEQYYQRYFTNRAQIAGFAAQYQAEFNSRQVTVAQDDARLATLKKQIETGEADLKTRQEAIKSAQATLLSQRGSNVAAYNAGVPAYNASIDAYNTEAQTIQDTITQYNQLVASRNAVAGEEDQLVKDLSTGDAAPIQQ